MGSTDNMEELLARKKAIEARISATPALAKRLRGLRAWQAGRLAQTYDDLRSEPRYSAAVEFFLTDLYGPQDLSRRDSDLMRAWSYFKPVLPAAALEVLEFAVTLDVLSAELDQAMVEQLRSGELTHAAYAEAYRRVGSASERQRQIGLLIGIGEDLDRIVRSRWIGVALRAARVPARAAGFGALQVFLERGFAAFRQMKGAQHLLKIIRTRETQLMDAMFSGGGFGFRTVGAMRAGAV
jgi:hypothetical protein